MARPIKSRRVCSFPENRKFGPIGNCNVENILGIDEYETIRLIDYEGLTQEQCAKQMKVARPTITLIYENARKKIADSLVNNKGLIIEGGNVEVCKNTNDNCCGTCGKSQ